MNKSTMTITLETDIKTNLKETAKEMWTNASNLLSMIIVKFIKDKQKYDPLNNIEFENFSIEEMKAINGDKEFQKEIEEMNKLIAKVS